MTREIKFRGKRIDTGEWVYGSLLQWKDGDATICANESENNNVLIKHDVNSDTVGQYTGLEDRNGKEIYPGDILAASGRIIGYVKDGVRGYCYDVVYINHPAGESDWSLYSTVKYDYPEQIEVIGNRWDNLELLEGEK